MSKAIIAVIAVGVIAVLTAMYKSKHFFKSFFLTALQGILSLLAVNIIGMLTGVTIAVNWYTLGSSAVFGIPSSITLTVLNLLLK